MGIKKAVVNKKSKPKTTVSKAPKKTTTKKNIKKSEIKKADKKIEKKPEKKVVKKTTKKAEIKKIEVKKNIKKTARKTADKHVKNIADQLADKLKLFDTKTHAKKTVKSEPKGKVKEKLGERTQILTFTSDLFSYQEIKNTKEETTLTKYDIGAHTTSVEYAYDPMKTEELSPLYYIDRVVILPIDPKFAFTYWEVKEETLNHFFQMHGYDSKLTLRIYDVTNIEFDGYNAHEWWDVEIYNRLGTWYLRHFKSDRSLIVDIGVVSTDGNFHVIARSRSIYFPRDHMVAPGKILWMLVDEFGNKVISEIEDYTEEDLKLLRKILGEDRFKLFMKGGLDVFLGGSLWGRLPVIENFIDLAKIPSSGKLLSSPGSSWPTSMGGKSG